MGLLLYVNDKVLLAEHEQYLQTMLYIVVEWGRSDQYKYLGLKLDEHMMFKEAASVVAQSAGRALGSVLSKVVAIWDPILIQNSNACVCLIMLQVFGFSLNIGVVTLCIIKQFSLIWESIHLLQFRPLVDRNL